MTRLKSEFCELLVNAVVLHGPDALQALAEGFVNEWDGNSNYWSSNAIRDITLALYTAGMGGEWASEQLERVERLIADDEVLPRVEEEVKQVDAWLTLGKLARAKESLKRALLDSSSVGSKDYQLGEWIKWMARANKLEPEGAPKRIVWFAQAVADLERNGGPSKDAAYDLLEAAFEWSPRRAVRLFYWLSQRGLIDFDDAVRALLRAALASSANSSTYVAMILIEFLLPVSDVDNDLVQLLVNRLFEKLGKDGVTEFAREFNSALEKHSLPSNRRSWRSSLAKSLQARGVDISVAGLGGEDLVHKKDRGTDDGLTLKDGTKLPTDEVIEKASTVDGLRELVQQQEGHFYHWDEVIANLAPKLENSAEVLEVVSIFSARAFSARTLIKLAERLRELGDADHARQVANDALVGSETSGWAVQLSGGTKIAAYQVLTELDGEQARDQAFKSLVEDMTGTFRYPGYIVQNLNEILPLLITKVPEKEIWKEIEPYVHSLFPGVDEKNQESGLLDVLRATPDADTPVRALIELLQLHIAHAIKLLSNSAQTVFIKLLIKEEPMSLDVMRQLMKGSEAEQESALMVLDAASSRNSDVASGFEDELREFSESPNFALRVVANRVSQRIGVSLPIVHSGRVAASSIYQLSLPPSRETDTVWDDSERTAFDFLPETDNPHELLKIQMVYFNWMAARTGLPLENLIQRAAQIVRELTQEDEWAKQGEKWLRNRFNVVGLRYTYIRPRATLARRAFFHVAAELADAGKLKAEDFQEMNSAFDYFDPDMFFVKPVARPNFVFPMPGGRFREDSASPPISGATDGVPSLQTDDGLIIFGEYTKIKRLEWETPTIIRQSVIGIERPDESEGRHSFFKRTSFCLIQNYHKLNMAQSSSNSLVIRHELRAYDSPGPEWMAFNPALARSIGWTPVDESLFGWADDSGRLMVWSIWWQDGLYQSQPPKFYDDVGEGWAVIGLPEAVETIAAHVGGQLKQYLRIEQSRQENGERKSEVRFEESILDEHILQTSS